MDIEVLKALFQQLCGCSQGCLPPLGGVHKLWCTSRSSNSGRLGRFLYFELYDLHHRD